MDNDVVEDGCLVPVVDGVYNGVVVGGYVLPVKKDAVVWTVVVVVFAGVVKDVLLDIVDVGLVVGFSVVVGSMTFEKDGVVWTLFVVFFAGVIDIVLLYFDDILNGVYVGLVVVELLESFGVLAVKR